MICPRGSKPCPWRGTRHYIPWDAGWACCALQLVLSAAYLSNWPPMRRARLLPLGVFNSPSPWWSQASHAPIVLPAVPQQSVGASLQSLKAQVHLWILWWWMLGATDQGRFSILSAGLICSAVGQMSGSAALLLCTEADMEGRAFMKSLPKSSWGLRGLLPVKIAVAPTSPVKVFNFSWVHLSFCPAGGYWQTFNWCCLSCWKFLLPFVTKHFVRNLSSACNC